MEQINTEALVASLFAIGFDRVDALLYTYVLGQLTTDNYKLQIFEFGDSETSSKFNEFADYDGVAFKIKEGITLETNVSPIGNHVWPLEKALSQNKKLIEYLSKLDFRKIIIKKISALGIDRINDLDELFSNKEKEIMYKMFGIENMHRENSIRQSQVISDLYNQESRDTERMIIGLDKPLRNIYSESAEIEEIIKDIQKRKRKK